MHVTSTNKRLSSSTAAPPQDEKPKADSTDASLLFNPSRKRLRTLVLPARKKKTPFIDLKALASKEPEKKECYECPLCADIIYAPYPPKLNRLIKKIKENERQYEKEMRGLYEEQVAVDRAEGRPSMPFAFEPAGISLNDKRLICRTHRIELIFKPMAVEKGYPTNINFEGIEDRIKCFEDEIKLVVDRVYPSSYLDAAMKRFKELGVKARRAEQVMKEFEDFLPGYYGNKGSDAIMSALNKSLLHTGYINEENTAPLTPIEFLQRILVPECGLRLIQQDRKGHNDNITLEEARVIMKESEQYGSLVHRRSLKLEEKFEDKPPGEDIEKRLSNSEEKLSNE